MKPSQSDDRSSLAFLGTGFSIAALVGGSAWVGKWLDGRWGTHPWMLVLGVTLGFSVAMIDLLQLVKRYDRQKREHRP